HVMIEDKCDFVPLDSMNGMNADELIRTSGKDNSWFVSIGGSRVDGTVLLSSLSLVERSSIRIVEEVNQCSSQLPTNFEDTIEKLYKQMKKILSSNRSHMIADYISGHADMEEIRKKFGQMMVNSILYTIFNDFYTFKIFFSECTTERAALIREHPFIVDACLNLVDNVTIKHQGLRETRAARAAAATGAAAAAAAAGRGVGGRGGGGGRGAQPALFSADAINAAINSAMAANAQIPPSIAAPLPLPRNNNDLRQEYRTQLIQLREYGFEDDEINIQVLIESNGELGAAIELLIAMRESMEE
ncbi:hypothetical protein PFISCL1PPCAC_19937, partial [Pristionchus fissidentatus]